MIDTIFAPQTFVYLAGTFYVMGLLIINQIVLRLMVLAGTGFYLFYYATVAQTPLWEAIYISALIGVANLIGIAGLLARNSPLALPRAHRDIVMHFPALPPGDFRTLMQHAKRTHNETPLIMTVEGAPLTKLFYVIEGRTSISKRGECFEVPSGVFVGEVAYLTGQRASATTKLAPGSEYLEWSVMDLRKASTRKARFKMALESVLSLDLAYKVATSVAPHGQVWRPDLALVRPELELAHTELESSFS